MRALLRRRTPGDCSACGSTLVRGATWCGECGAAVVSSSPAAAAETVVVAPGDGAAGDADQGHPGRRRGLGLLVLVAVAAVVAAGLLRSPPAVAVLGTPAGSNGLSATGPPPDGLRLAWQQPIGTQDPGGFTSWSAVEVAADADRVAVDGRVVDRSTGRLVRLAPVSFGGEGLVLEGDRVLRVDPLSGAQEVVATIPRLDLGWPRAVLGDVVVLSDDRRTTLLRTDGVEIGEVEGAFQGFLDRAADDAVLLPVRTVGDGEASSPILLVDPTDGTVVRMLEQPGGTHVVDVVGETVVHAATSVAIGGPGTGVEWGVEVLDPATGGALAEGVVTSAHAPRLLGTWPDGTVVVGGRSGGMLTAWLLQPGIPPTDPFLTSRALTTSNGDLLAEASGDITSQLLLVGDVLVAADGEDDVVRAVDRAGTEAWSVPAAGTRRLGAGDGLVALLREDPTGEDTRGAQVLDAVDGRVVVVVPPGVDPWGQTPAPAAVHGGHVAVGDGNRGMPGFALRLAATRWYDLRTGAVATSDEVLAPFVPQDGRVDLSWLLHGFATTPDGATVPVITRNLESDTMQLLDPRVGFTAVDLREPADDSVASFYAEVAGISVTHLLVFRQDFTTGRGTSHLVERSTGAAQRLEDVMGYALFGDLAVGITERFGPGATVPGAVGIDVADGSERWRSEDATSMLFGDRVVGDEDGLLSVDRRGAVLTDLDDGATAWQHTAPEVLWSTASVLGRERVLLATTDGDVVALDRQDGTELWRTGLGTPITAMTGAGRDVLVGTVDGLVIHLDGNGAEVQRLAVGTTAVTSVAALGDTVVAVADDLVVGLRADGDGVVEQDEVDLP